MRKTTKRNFATILSSIFILLLVVGVLGYILVFTEDFTTPLKKFYVTYGNDDFIADRENFDIVVGKEYKFEIITNIDVDGTENKYIVSVVPNETSTTTFSYIADETAYNYVDIQSLAKGFSIVANDDYFILTARNDLPEILKFYHGTQTIQNVPTAIDTDLPYFRLVVQSADLTETININFNLKSE